MELLLELKNIFFLNYRKVLPSVEPGYINDLVPEDPPEEGESWKNIMEDVERVVIPGITHWQSPQFHAYYPTATSYPSIVGEIISAGLGIVGFSWVSFYLKNFQIYFEQLIRKTNCS